MGRGDEAVEEERARCLAEPDDLESRLALMPALYWTGRYEEVLSAFEETPTRVRSQESIFYIYAGDACDKFGRYDDSFTHWNRAIELNPEHADPLYSMAFCFHARGEYAR